MKKPAVIFDSMLNTASAVILSFLAGILVPTMCKRQTDNIVTVTSEPTAVTCEGVAVGQTRTRPCPVKGFVGQVIERCEKVDQNMAKWKEEKSTCVLDDSP